MTEKTNTRRQNIVEKIAQCFAVGLKDGHVVHAGDYLLIRPAHVMTHDNTGAVIPKFRSIGASRIANPRQPVYALDHNVQDTSETNLTKYKKIEAFASEMGVDFYPAGRGIGHQIMCEEGYAWPGTMVVASDSHSNMYGGLGCLGTPIVRTDAAAIWATGRTWWQVPPVAKVVLKGKLRPGVTGKDVIVALCGHFNKDQVLNQAIEFAGDSIATLSIDDRLAIANMTTEWGALAGVFPIDEVTLRWLEARIAFVGKRGLAGVPSDADGKGAHPRLNTDRLEKLRSEAVAADAEALYSKELTLELDSVTPHVSGPNHVKVMTPVSKMKNVKIHKAYLVSCVNSRVQDLAEAAKVVKGKKVSKGVKFYIAAASSEVEAESRRRGDWQTLLDSGAIELPPGCGPCIGLGAGLLEDGEVGISATNRNFKGRMGSKQAEAYLASPAVVAASAIAGHVAMPFEMETAEIIASINVAQKPSGRTEAVAIIDGFPPTVEGDLVFCHQDNLNTDGIYPGKYTYIDDFTPKQQAGVVMENYDPEFGGIVKEGDILAGGFNFGTGSSREQAATALKYRGIRLVLAGSFSETYKRNAINNGFLAIEAPELANDLKATYGADKLTVPTGEKVRIDFTQSELSFDGKNYSISPVGAAAQELIVTDGLENWVKKNL
ncbi:MAG: homoaconitase [Candidatus Zixiibacteriota bacterium]|nr:MAG: homoaconitase [candidate division Zixibacteria bacterium]